MHSVECLSAECRCAFKEVTHLMLVVVDPAVETMTAIRSTKRI